MSVPLLSPVLTPHLSQTVRKPLAWGGLQLHRSLAQLSPLPPPPCCMFFEPERQRKEPLEREVSALRVRLATRTITGVYEGMFVPLYTREHPLHAHVHL